MLWVEYVEKGREEESLAKQASALVSALGHRKETLSLAQIKTLWYM